MISPSKRLAKSVEQRQASKKDNSIDTVQTNNLDVVDSSNSETNNQSKTKCQGLTWAEYNYKHCLICLTTDWFPLPHDCGHVFCFSCVTDVVQNAEHCPICHEPLPVYSKKNYRKQNPSKPERKEEEKNGTVNYQWSYKETVWKQYEQKTSSAIEQNYNNNKHKFDLFINGIMYTFDLKYKMQFKKDNPGKRNKMKRVNATL